MIVELVVYRIYGQPKIHKPKELKGIKPSFSLPLNSSGRKNQVYIKDKDVWVYFFDLFSREHAFPDPEDAGLPTAALRRKYPDVLKAGGREKFIYPDSWATILDRNEGCVRFPGLISEIFKDTWNTVWLLQLEFAVTEALAELSETDRGFDSIVSGTFRYADYLRFISNVICKIYSTKELKP